MKMKQIANRNFKFEKTKVAEISQFAKLPPSGLDSERIILGSILSQPNKIEEVVDIIHSGELFYTDAHQRIYNAALSLYQSARSIDPITVCEKLIENQDLEIVGGRYEILKLVIDCVGTFNIEAHARILSEKFMKREIIRISGEAINDAYEDSTDALDLVDDTASQIENLQINQVKKDYQLIGKAADDVMRDVEELQANDGALSGITSGFAEIDKLTGGWQQTDLIILAARPAVGKTAFALNLVYNAFNKQRVKEGCKPKAVLVFSLEMSTKQLIKRMLANHMSIQLEKLKKGGMNPAEYRDFIQGIYDLKNMQIFIDDTAAITEMELRAKVRRAKRKQDIGLIVIDYLQLMGGSGNKNQNREQEISQISRGLKKIAKETECPIIALSQLSRSIETRTIKIPQLSDLRESGAIEQDADLIMFLYQPPDSNGEICLSIAKHRDGELGKFGALFNGALQRFGQFQKLEFKPQTIKTAEQINEEKRQESKKLNADWGNQGVIFESTTEDPF
jgi:replicative DNA helicase